jgi:hypothetical protein
MADPTSPLDQQRLASVSTVDAKQVVKKIPGQTSRGSGNVDVNDSANNFGKSIDTSNTSGTYSGNEFDPTVLNGPAATRNRVACVITTDQRMMGGRLLQNLPPNALAPSFGDTNAQKAAKKQRQALQTLGWKISKDGTPVLQDDFGRSRNPFEAIILHINPSEVSIQQSIRGVESKNKSGTVLYTWRDRKRKTFFDEPVVQFTFHSGNIAPFSYIGDLKKKKTLEAADYNTQPIARGLANYYRFLELLDDRKILPDGRPNFVYITHSSRVYPKLTLVGFFHVDGVNVQESANEPNQISWQASFTCRFTYPQLSDSRALMEVYNSLKLMPPAAQWDNRQGEE